MTKVAMKSWFQDPVGNGVEKAGRDDGFAGMVLHRDYRGFGIERAVGVAQPQNIGELQGRAAGKKNFAGSAKFDDSAFLDASGGRVASAARVIAAGELDGNTYRRGLGEKAGEFGDRAGLCRPRLSCGWLRQAMFTLSLDSFSTKWRQPPRLSARQSLA
jgi:hypothetical protein